MYWAKMADGHFPGLPEPRIGLRDLGIELGWFGVVGYVVAGLMGLGLVWAIFRS